MKRPDLKSELMEVTPALATKWLELNTDNRNISDKWVEAIAADIAAGKWDPNNASIALHVDEKGEPTKVVDGQHRLWGIVSAKRAVWTLVVFGDEHNLRRENIDRVKPRSVSDQLMLLYGVKSARRVAAACSVLKALETISVGHDVLTLEQANVLRERHRAGFEWINAIWGGGTPINNGRVQLGSVSGALVYAYPTSPEKLERFALQVRDGENITKLDPAYALRSYIDKLHVAGANRSSVSRVARHEVVVMTLRAVTAAIKGQQLSALKPGAIMGGGFYKEACAYFARSHGIGPGFRKRSA